MRETRAAARAQLIRASNLEDLSDANYRQKVFFCLIFEFEGEVLLTFSCVSVYEH
jgi:hypothetical protein